MHAWMDVVLLQSYDTSTYYSSCVVSRAAMRVCRQGRGLLDQQLNASKSFSLTYGDDLYDSSGPELWPDAENIVDQPVQR